MTEDRIPPVAKRSCSAADTLEDEVLGLAHALFQRCVERHGADADGAEIIMFPLSSAEPNPEAETGREQVRRLLEDAVDRLPEPFRLVFILRDVEGLGTEAAATLLSIKPETVKTRLFRARRLMRAEMEKALLPRFSDVFPFAGKRCALMVDRVIERLRTSP